MSIPENLRKNVFKEVPATPTVEFVMKEAVKTESIPKEKRDQIQALLDSGQFSKKKTIENPRIAKMVDEYVTREIKKSVKAGRLPNKTTLKNLPHMKEIYAKIHKTPSSK